MPKLWSILGLTSLLVALGLYFDQESGMHLGWSWEQFLYYEYYFPLAVSVGMILLLVAVVDFFANKKGGKK